MNARTYRYSALLAVAIGILLWLPANADNPVVGASAPQNSAAKKPAVAKPTRAMVIGRQKGDMAKKDYDKDCMRSGCHTSLKKTPWVHGPVAVGGCEVCHIQQDEKLGKHKFKLKRIKEKTCTHCHQPGTTRKVVHKVVTDTGCIKCHSPHGGEKRNLLNTQDESKLCGECHDPNRPMPMVKGKKVTVIDKTLKASPKFKTMHKPVKEGKCLVCHEAHDSSHKKLLVKAEKDLCYSCHEKAKKALAKNRFLHKPVTESCSLCHAPHGTNSGKMLVSGRKQLCLDCHKDVAESIDRGIWMKEVKPTNGMAKPTLVAVTGPSGESLKLHGAIKNTKDCLACHEAHGGTDKLLVKVSTKKACFECHAKAIPLKPRGKIADIKAELAAGKHLHKPVKEGRCTSCHAGHASANTGLLAKPYAKGLYAMFSVKQFELCFDCHNKKLATMEKTLTTKFRDGDRNLHYVHIHEKPAKNGRPKKKGRSCRMCHESHVSHNSKQMRKEVPYGPGGWKLAINHVENPTGGTCTAACHKKMAYDNTKKTGLLPKVPAKPEVDKK